MPSIQNVQLAELCSRIKEPLDEEETLAKYEYVPQIHWRNVIKISLFHLIALYALIFKFHQAKLITIIYGYCVMYISGFGVTAGPHRLWSHRSYKAKWQLKVLLLMFYSMSGQNSVYDWVRDHRVHHKYSETDADPHNSNRGFFFAHVGWLMQKKHPEVLRRGNEVDMSDITGDPIVSFHTKYYAWFNLLLCFILPTLIPIYCWGEDVSVAILGMAFMRYIIGLNIVWLVNSAAHIYGNKPYDKNIKPAENITVSWLTIGEGWHNYHHVFPWDYKAAELGNYWFDLTTYAIECFAKIGWAYDLKAASPTLITKVLEKHGEGTHPYQHKTD